MRFEWLISEPFDRNNRSDFDRRDRDFDRDRDRIGGRGDRQGRDDDDRGGRDRSFDEVERPFPTQSILTRLQKSLSFLFFSSFPL